MAFTDIFVKRPVLALVINVLIVIAGIQAAMSLTVRQYPRNDNAVVTITTAYVGASADLVRGFVTTPLERAISGSDGIEYIDSSSTLGLSTINVRLELNYDPIRALAEINSKVNQVRSQLPPEAEVPVINVESADSQFASAYLSFSSDILEQNEITDYLVRVVQPRLASVDGVQRAEILGGRTFAMRIWLDSELMAGLGVSPSEVARALSTNNFLAPVGRTKGALVQNNLTANTDLNDPAEFEQLVVKGEGSNLIRLGDIAQIELGSQDYDTEVRLSGQTAVFMGIWPQPNANALDVIQGVRAELELVKEGVPTGLEVLVGYDSTEYIENAISEVVKTLGETLLIVVIVIFLFLGSIRAVVIPVLAIPLSLIGALFLMQLMGFSLNLLTLLAIVLSVGLVVDDAIVVVENVERHLSEGESPMQAAMKGAKELIGPVLATTFVLVAVYLPIGLQGGLTGSLFREFAFTLAGAVIVSTIVALTLSPMMASRMLKKDSESKGFAGWIGALLERLRLSYERSLQGSLRQRGPVYFVWALVSLASVGMLQMAMSGKELAPTEDQGVIFGIVDAPPNSTLDQASYYASAVNDVFLAPPEANFSFQITFPSGGFSGVVLEPWSDRERTAQEVLNELQGGLMQIPGWNLFPVLPPALPGGGDFPVEFLITSTAEPDQILEFAQQLQMKAAQSGMFAFPPTIDTHIDQPTTRIEIDRDKVASLGMTLEQVGRDLAVLLSGNFINRFNVDGRSYQVIPQIQRAQRLTPDLLENLYISGPGDAQIPLAAVAQLVQETGPRSLNRFQQQNAVKLSGVNIVPLGQALEFLETEAEALLPQNFSIDHTGESRQLIKEGNSFLPAFGLAVVMIFMVLSAQFNSFRDPLVILLGSVPLAMFGALIFMFLKMPNPNQPFWTDDWTTTMNIYSQVGLVTLIGLVAKNGILIVEFANKLQEAGRSKLEAVTEASSKRLRPILMTTAATVAGHFPLVLVTGAGAEARNSIGLVLVGGMAIGTLFTLFVVPAIYMWLAKDHQAEQLTER